MYFAAIYVPEFPVEAILRVNPDLREQAVAVMEGTAPLLRVIACNGKAAQSGVEAGMSRMQAGACLPQSGIRQRSASLEAAAHAALLDCACVFSPRVEETAVEAVVLDLTGLERIFGSPAKIARDLARRCSDMGMEVNVAVASNPDTALLAARGFAGVTVIATGKEGDRLGELPIDVLLGIGRAGIERAATQKGKARSRQQQRTEPVRLEQILQTLDRWGVRNLRALAALPEVAISERLGEEGLRLQRLARGAVSRPLIPMEPPLQFEEVAEMEYPVDLLEPLAFVLNHMLEQLCARLEARSLSTHELKLRLELEGNQSPQRRRGAGRNHVSSRVCGESIIHERTLHVPVPMRDAKVFLKLLQMDLKRSPPEAPVQKIWLRAEPVCPRVLQGRLFLPAVPPPEKLELTLARIAGVLNSPPRRRDAETSDSRFLNSDLSHERENTSANQKSDLSNRQFLGSPELLDTHRPGAFRMRHFVPLDAAHATNAVHERQRPAILPVTALRRLRPPVPLAVEVREGRPLRLYCDGHADLTGQVVWSAGPWRSSGAWWDCAISNSQFANSDCSKGAEQEEEVVAAQTEAEAGWSREDWDIAVRNQEGVVVCRACCEQGLWSVEGIYD